MKIADLDFVTRKVIFRAHLMVKSPSNQRLRQLRQALDEFDRTHAEERYENLLRNIFGEPGVTA